MTLRASVVILCFSASRRLCGEISLAQRLKAAEGSEAVYMEGAGCTLVRIDKVDVSDWGVTIRVGLIADLSSDKPSPGEWGAGGCWSVATLSGFLWSFRYSGTLYPDAELVRNVKSAEFPLATGRLARRRLTDLISDLETRRREVQRAERVDTCDECRRILAGIHAGVSAELSLAKREAPRGRGPETTEAMKSIQAERDRAALRRIVFSHALSVHAEKVHGSTGRW